MPNKLSEEEVRDIYVNRLKEDLIGPKSGTHEVISEDPISRYLSGILWPSNTPPEDNEFDESDDVEDNDSEETSNFIGSDIFRQMKPSCAGITFTYECDEEMVPELELKISFAVYRQIFHEDKNYNKELLRDDADEDSSAMPHQWMRVPVKVEESITIDQTKIKKTPVLNLTEGIDVKFEVLIHSRKIENRTKPTYAITIKGINVKSLISDEDLEQDQYITQRALSSIFQFEMEVRPKDTGKFCERPVRTPADDEDSKISELIYRDSPEFATGHVCSVNWDQDSRYPESIKTTWMPSFVVEATSTEGAKEIQDEIEKGSGSKVISANYLSEENKENVIKKLDSLLKGYGSWIAKEKKKIKDLSGELKNQAIENLSNCEKASSRIKEGIDLLKKNEEAFFAFQLANESMQIQFEWQEKERERETEQEAIQKDFSLNWRPFQIAFALLCLPSVTSREHPDREIFDLLWFPTGGGKTEAYLLLIAYLLFLRRISQPETDKRRVEVFMRYTLRALTEQQFTRASFMIFACDLVRRKNSLGNTPFSIGLWVGGDATPNSWNDTLTALSHGNPHNSPKKIFTCPCCGNPLKTKKDSSRKALLTLCVDKNCGLYGELPISTIDVQNYREPPSLLVSTVDKFAQIVRRGPYPQDDHQGTLAFFDEQHPPDLIIQDELHLINGPLGSMVGLLEIALDELCKNELGKPKILGSTATIRQATKQVKRIYARKSFQFPPPAIDSSDSGFSTIDKTKPGRMYVGITSEGRSEKMMRENLSASILQSVEDSRISKDLKDLYSTLVSYFGSLRILGGALVGLQESTPGFMRALAEQRKENRRSISRPEELTSRVSSSQLSDMLKNILTKPYGENRHKEIVLATNMISVGVDVPRLNLMSVNGQPKSMTEYIQATSRVGRRQPGLILTLYNHARIRDKSFYESFQTWHSSLYRSVEATTVTPFAPRAMEKALLQPLMAIYRHRIAGETGIARIQKPSETYDKLYAAIENILERAEYCSSLNHRNYAKDLLDDFMKDWVELSKEINHIDDRPNLRFFWNERNPTRSLLISSETAASRAAMGRKPFDAFQMPNSARNVDVTAHFKLIETDSPTSNNYQRRNRILGGRRRR